MNTDKLPRYCMNLTTGQLEEVDISVPVVPNPAWTTVEDREITGMTFREGRGWFWLSMQDGEVIEAPMAPQPPELTMKDLLGFEP